MRVVSNTSPIIELLHARQAGVEVFQLNSEIDRLRAEAGSSWTRRLSASSWRKWANKKPPGRTKLLATFFRVLSGQKPSWEDMEKLLGIINGTPRP